ncbi:MAG TPA: peptide ABC transporter substrate-binding protein [Paracoccus sp. (in: a-proteobacteria)]|nr:peptide ABC transporter substrate-binding protein [Paracoccus sp. (in: a-proteobacteria)]
MTKLFLTTALAACIALPALAAEPAEGEKLADRQTYDFWLLDAVKTLDPQKNTDRPGADVINQLFEGLAIEDARGAMIPGAAESWTLSDDRKTHTFKLREARWSNGDPVTANDFVFAWRRLVDPKTASEYAWYAELANIANASEIIKGEKPATELGVRAVDDRTLEVTLTQPTPYFLKMQSNTALFPVPQKVVEAEGDNWTRPGKLVGNGAYVLTGHDLGVQVTMKKNDNYRDAASTILTDLKFTTVNDVNAGLTRYLAGELDYVEIPAGQYPRLEKEYPDAATVSPNACTYAYIMNLSDKGPEALKDKRVRQALMLGMQRDIVVNNILQGGQKPAWTWTHWAIEGFVAPDNPWEKMTQENRTARAKELLAEAGYGPDKPLTLTLQYNTSEDHKKIAVAAQQFYKQLGVDLTLNNVEWKVHTDRMQNQDFDIARYAWCADYNEPSTFLDYFRSTGKNEGRFVNADYDAALDHSKTAEDPSGDYRKAEAILADEIPAVFVYHYASVAMRNPAVKGVPLENPMNTWYAKDLYRIAP